MAKTHPVPVRLDESQEAALAQIAKEIGRPKSMMFRASVIYFVERFGDAPQEANRIVTDQIARGLHVDRREKPNVKKGNGSGGNRHKK